MIRSVPCFIPLRCFDQGFIHVNQHESLTTMRTPLPDMYVVMESVPIGLNL